MHILVWDLEIAENVEDHADGWEAAKRGDCGVSSVCIYDNLTERYHLYDEHTLTQAVDHLNHGTLLVGFNTLDFDTPCLQGVAGSPIHTAQYDILQAVWKALGHREKGYRLGEICSRTIGLHKTGHGASAPTLYRQGRFGELFDYNLSDVHITRKLFNHIVDTGYILRPDLSKLSLTRGTNEHA